MNDEGKTKRLFIGANKVQALCLAHDGIEPGTQYVCYKISAPKTKEALEGYHSGFLHAIAHTDHVKPDLFLVSLETIETE